MALRKHGRKLLVASVGVAAVSYVACGGDDTVANLVAPPATTTGAAGSGGTTGGGGAGGGDAAMPDAPKDQNPPPNWDVIANLVPPPRD